ncbi:MAG: hypothetical protein H6719_21360 [Sandaracinaceae bacterium]|nr:hypothetical protein [Sandaracinaceae bacterium]
MTIELHPDHGLARRQANAIVAFLVAIGRAQRDAVGRGLRFALAEGDAVTAVDGRLHIDEGLARAGRGAVGLSWTFLRLYELVESDAVVRPRLTASIARGGAYGVTRPDFGGHAVPGRTYAYLPAPASSVEVTVATSRRRSASSPSWVPRTSLDIGRTLIHELCVHAWRDVSFYQPPPGGGLPGRPAQESRHRAAEHAMARPGTPHNLADAEGDLIDHYWDLETTRRNGRRVEDPHVATIVNQVGGVMGRRILQWMRETAALRQASAELRRERARFVERRDDFERSQRRRERR